MIRYYNWMIFFLLIIASCTNKRSEKSLQYNDEQFIFYKAVCFENSTIVKDSAFIHKSNNNLGLVKRFYPSGKLRIKAFYYKDKLNGPFTVYDEDGKIVFVNLYSNGSLVE